MANENTLETVEDATAEDVVAAIEFAFMGQRDPEKRIAIVELLMTVAPETTNGRGFELITLLLAQTDLKLEVTDASLHRY